MPHSSKHRSGFGRAGVTARCALATLLLVMACWPGLTFGQTVETPTVALGLYQTVFPDELSAVHDFVSRTGHPLSIVHWYAIWGGWKSEFEASDFQAVS